MKIVIMASLLVTQPPRKFTTISSRIYLQLFCESRDRHQRRADERLHPAGFADAEVIVGQGGLEVMR